MSVYEDRRIPIFKGASSRCGTTTMLFRPPFNSRTRARRGLKESVREKISFVFYRSAAFNRFVVFCNCRFKLSTCFAISSNSSFATNPALAT
jgi:hypothetical protein